MKKSILLADDSATIRRVVELTFADTDFRVECATTGNEALERFEELRPDVVLADVVMPGPTGYDICQRIKASPRPVPVLLLAGTFESFDHERARACGADGCLLKPFEARTLVARVRSLVASREALGESSLEPLPEVVPPDASSRPGLGEEARQEEARPSPARVLEDATEEPETDPPLPAGMTQETIDAIARAVVRRLSGDVVREVAREILPELAEAAVRRRLRELDREEG
jgi:CheY-like chemotaxis protein